MIVYKGGAAAVARRHGITPGELAVIRASRTPDTARTTATASSSVPPAPSTMPIPWQHYTGHEARAEHGRITAWLAAIAGKGLSAAQRERRDTLAERCRNLIQMF